MLIPAQFVPGFLLVFANVRNTNTNLSKYNLCTVIVHRCETPVYNYYIQKINDNETNFTDN